MLKIKWEKIDAQINSWSTLSPYANKPATNLRLL